LPSHRQDDRRFGNEPVMQQIAAPLVGDVPSWTIRRIPVDARSRERTPVQANLCQLISHWSKHRDCRIKPVPMNPVLKLLIEGGSLTTGQMAQVAGISEAQVQQHLEQLKKDKIFLGWRPVLDLSHEAAAAAAVRAVIEVKITPERGGGFNRLADRLARFDEVESCYLMSGGYDLLVFVKGSSLQKVAGFVSEKLSTIEGVLSTSTHFMLRCYKEQGFLLDGGEAQSSRLNVAP
jgi:DNA-binding Lrp family transcriptional regulator